MTPTLPKEMQKAIMQGAEHHDATKLAIISMDANKLENLLARHVGNLGHGPRFVCWLASALGAWLAVASSVRPEYVEGQVPFTVYLQLAVVFIAALSTLAAAFELFRAIRYWGRDAAWLVSELQNSAATPTDPSQPEA